MAYFCAVAFNSYVNNETMYEGWKGFKSVDWKGLIMSIVDIKRPNTLELIWP